MPASDSESDFIYFSLYHGIQKTSFARLHGLHNEKCESYHHSSRLPPTPHHLARRYTLCDPYHYPNNERLHVARCRHQTYNARVKTVSRPSRLFSPSSPTSLPFTLDYLQVTNVRAFILCSLFSFLTGGLTAMICEIGPPVFQAA